MFENVSECLIFVNQSIDHGGSRTGLGLGHKKMMKKSVINTWS